MDYQSFQPGGQEQNQASVPPSTIEPVPRKNFTPKFIGVIVLLLVLGAGAYGAMWYWQKQQVAQEVAPTFTPRPSASADPTADWKTYTNTQYGFEFKYPSDFTPEYLSSNKLIANTGNIEIDYWNLDALSQTSVTKTTINGHEAYIRPSNGGIGTVYYTILIKTSDNHFVGIIYTFYTENSGIKTDLQQELTKFNQILSTFKFIPLEKSRP